VPLPLPETLSPTKMSLFRKCGLAFRFSAIDRLPEQPTYPAIKGSLVHLALEKLLGEVPSGKRDKQAARQALESARVALSEEFAFQSIGETAVHSLIQEASILLDNYFELEDPDSVRAESLEEMLEADLGEVRIRGIVDRASRDAEGRVVITDYKTGRPPLPTHEQDSLLGLYVYAFLWQLVKGEMPTRIELYYLQEPIAISAKPTTQALRGVKTKVEAIWDAIKRACEREEFHPRPSALCSACQWQPYCPAFGGDPADARRNAELIGS
jgi:putative RecB family exonuclease